MLEAISDSMRTALADIIRTRWVNPTKPQPEALKPKPLAVNVPQPFHRRSMVPPGPQQYSAERQTERDRESEREREREMEMEIVIGSCFGPSDVVPLLWHLCIRAGRRPCHAAGAQTPSGSRMKVM